MCRHIADDLLSAASARGAAAGDGTRDLLGGDPVRERALHALARNLPNDEVWEATLEGHKQVQHCGLQRVICRLVSAYARYGNGGTYRCMRIHGNWSRAR
jgi:hypothetical protein